MFDSNPAAAAASPSYKLEFLAGDRALVTFTDSSRPPLQTVLDAAQYHQIERVQAQKAAAETLDSEIDAFFKPLIEASEKYAAAHAATEDPAFKLVLQEPTEGTADDPGVVINLEKDTVILRMIQAGDTSRLIWVGDQLELRALPTN